MTIFKNKNTRYFWIGFNDENLSEANPEDAQKAQQFKKHFHTLFHWVEDHSGKTFTLFPPAFHWVDNPLTSEAEKNDSRTFFEVHGYKSNKEILDEYSEVQGRTPTQEYLDEYVNISSIGRRAPNIKI